MHCTPFTAGSKLINYMGPVRNPTYKMKTTNLLLNSVVFAPSAKFMTYNIKYFYLNSPMD